MPFLVNYNIITLLCFIAISSSSLSLTFVYCFLAVALLFFLFFIIIAIFIFKSLLFIPCILSVDLLFHFHYFVVVDLSLLPFFTMLHCQCFLISFIANLNLSYIHCHYLLIVTLQSFFLHCFFKFFIANYFSSLLTCLCFIFHCHRYCFLAIALVILSLPLFYCDKFLIAPSFPFHLISFLVFSLPILNFDSFIATAINVLVVDCYIAIVISSSPSLLLCDCSIFSLTLFYSNCFHCSFIFYAIFSLPYCFIAPFPFFLLPSFLIGSFHTYSIILATIISQLLRICHCLNLKSQIAEVEILNIIV
jgi:hypothetical protein